MGGAAVSIIVVAYRQRELLLECLESCMVAAGEMDGTSELIVVDNDELGALVQERFATVRVVGGGENRGFAGGVMQGLAVASGSWIALVNDDARLAPDSLARLLATGEADPRIGSVAPQVRFASAPERINSAGIAVDALGIATERLAGRPVDEGAQACEVFGASASVCLYRRAMLEQIGGFDARFFAYQEDVDLAWRARAAGWLAVYEPAAIAAHAGSASSGEGSARKYYLVGRNRVRVLARNATTRQLVRALPAILLYDLAYVLYVAVTDRTLAPLRGRLAGLREWRRLRSEMSSSRREVKLGRRGWIGALRQHRAYKAS